MPVFTPRPAEFESPALHHHYRALVEGASIRSVERMTGVHRDTITRLMVRVGDTARENLEAAVAVHFAHYNLVRTHATLGTTPAVAAGIMPRPWRVADLIEASN